MQAIEFLKYTFQSVQLHYKTKDEQKDKSNEAVSIKEHHEPTSAIKFYHSRHLLP